MAGASNIEWTDATWNPVTGCTRVSSGCDHCYAVGMTHRLEGMSRGAVGTRNVDALRSKYHGLTVINGKGGRHFNGVVRCHEDVLEWPLHKGKPLRIFVNSMSDLFHRDVPFEFIDKVFAVMALCSRHTFQVLTKRPERMAEYLNRRKLIPGGTMMGGIDPWKTPCDYVYRIARQTAPEQPLGLIWPLPNVWLGTSVENQATADERIPHLLKCPAAVRFLSVEPMLGPVTLRLHPAHKLLGIAIDWVIVGGESGPGARPTHPNWVRAVRDQCKAAGVPFFFKQWGEWAPLAKRFHYTPKFGSGNREYVRALRLFAKQNAASAVIDDRREGWDRQMIEDGTCLNDGEMAMGRIGKKRAGADLDGVEHREFPQTKAEVVA